jgi:hypothetical protein
MKTFGFTYRHTLRYIRLLESENLLRLRYKQNGKYYYSVVRRSDEHWNIKNSI